MKKYTIIFSNFNKGANFAPIYESSIVGKFRSKKKAAEMWQSILYLNGYSKPIYVRKVIANL